jgi:PAS domain S-box-containing protein
MDKKESTRELVVVDVSRYKKVKKALHESEERYRQLFENVPIGIYRTTPDGRIVDSNPALVKMLGYESFAELAKRNLEKDFSDAGYKRADFIKMLEHDGEITGLESIWKRKDGDAIHVRENAKRIRTENGEVFFEGTVEDITLSKQAEEAQQKRSEQLEILNQLICGGNLINSMPELFDCILTQVSQRLNFETAAVYMLDASSKRLALAAHKGLPKKFLLIDQSVSIDEQPFDSVIKRAQPVFADRIRKIDPQLAKKWGWQLAGLIPLVSKGRVIGTLNVASGKREDFTPEEKDVLVLIGKEAGTLISKLQTEAALRESEKYYRTLIDTSPEIIVVLDLDGRLQMVNQQFLKTGGYFYDEVIDKSIFDFISGLDAITLANKTAAFIRRKKVSGSEYLFKKKDGRSIPLDASASVLHDDQGKPMGIIAIGRDISERMRAEEQLRFMSSITENTSDAIMVTDTDFAITYINKVGEKFFGYALDELKGKTPGILNAEPLAAQIQEKIYKSVARGQTYLGESLNRRKDGSTFYCEYKVMPLRDQSGKIYAYSSVQRDISERKRNEEVLRQNEDTFRRTFEAIPDPAYIWLRQADGRLILDKFNQAAIKITKGGIKNFLGIEAKKLFAGQPDFVTNIRQTMDTGQRQFSELLYEYQSIAQSKWLQVDYVKTAENSVMVITKDISERKEVEAKVLAYQEQLRALTSEMMLVEERERRRIASELHDQIGQNLALCKLKVTALEHNLNDEALKGELALVRRLIECSIQDARSLIFDLSPPVLYELGFSAALEWLAERMQEQFNFPVEFEGRLKDPELNNDQQVILFQVARELLMNVGKHSRASQVKIILSLEGPFLKLQVNDDGVGFDASRVFAPREPEGGFGFFSMRERLNYLGGGLEVKSTRGQGSQITVKVPLPGVAKGAKGKP